VIRKAIARDNEGIRAIYNHEVKFGTATFDNEERTEEGQTIWFVEHPALYPVLIDEEKSELRAWASLNRWSPRKSYEKTAEVSLYVAPAWQRQGIGKLLLPAILSAGREAGLHCVLARITEGNQISVDLHLKNGFATIGIMKEVGCKFDKLLDVTLMQKIL